MTLDKNIRESLLFMIAAREALTLFSEDVKVKNFLISEATDYEILSLLLNGVFPKEKYNLEEEILLFDKLQEQFLICKENLAEAFGVDILEPMKKIHTPYPFSSSKPNMEHQKKYLEEKKLSRAALLQLQRSRERIEKARELAKQGKGVKQAAEKGEEVIKKTADVAKKGEEEENGYGV
jgi:hypothetical protein